MRPWIANLTVALVVTATIGLVSGAGWPLWLAGGVWALALAVGVGFTGGVGRAWELRPAAYARSAVVALVAGGAIRWLAGGDNDVFWGVGVVLGIALVGTPTHDRVDHATTGAAGPSR